MKAKPQLCTILLYLVISTTKSYASVEYLRFEGNILDIIPYPDRVESNGFEFNQAVYFDFIIDTERVTPDGLYSSRFETIYFGGSYTGSLIETTLYTYDSFNVTFPFFDIPIPLFEPTSIGATSNIVEGIVSGLYFEDFSLGISVPEEQLDNAYDRNIETWVIGDTLALLADGYFEDNVIGEISLTYRSDIFFPSPPVAVALPPAIGLFGLSVFIMSYFGYRPRAHNKSLNLTGNLP